MTTEAIATTLVPVFADYLSSIPPHPDDEYGPPAWRIGFLDEPGSVSEIWFGRKSDVERAIKAIAAIGVVDGDTFSDSDDNEFDRAVAESMAW